jgi:hypothetical protein
MRPLRIPNEEFRVFDMFQLCCGGAASTNNNQHTTAPQEIDASTPPQPRRATLAVVLPSRYFDPSTKTPLPSLILQSTCLLLFCAIINTLFLIPYFDFVLVAERLHDLQFISFTPSYYQQPVAYPTRASGPFTPLTSRFTSRDTEGSKTPSRRHFLYIVASVALDAERVPSWHTATHSHTPAAGRRTNNHTTTATTTTASSRDYLHIHHSQANP